MSIANNTTSSNHTQTAGFTQIPNSILRDTTISPPAKALYALILSYSWGKGSAFPGHELLARELGASKRSVVRWTSELQASGLLKIERRGSAKPNLYLLESEVPTSHQRSARLSLRVVPNSHPKNTQVKKTHLRSDGLKAPGKESTQSLRDAIRHELKRNPGIQGSAFLTEISS